MARIYQVKDPSNNALNDIPLEDNAVLLSGYCSAASKIIQYSLVSRSDEGYLQAIYNPSAGINAFVDKWFYVGCDIYCYTDSTVLSGTQVVAGKFYSSYYDVPIGVNGGVYSHGFATGDEVLLKVQVNANGTKWKPLALIANSAAEMANHTGSFFIRLGSNKRAAEAFMLEQHKPLMYYDGTDLKVYDFGGGSALVGQGYGTIGSTVIEDEHTVYNVTMSGYDLENGYVTVKCTYNIAADSRFNINGKGSKPVYFNGAAITDGVLKNGDVALFYYDGVRYNLVCYMERYELVTSVSSNSTDTQYPSAKCLYDIVGDIETLLAAI